MTSILTISKLKLAALVTLVVLLNACSNALPRTEDATRSRWDSFDQAIDDYNKIMPYETTAEELKDLGYDPYTQPNIQILSYLDVIQRFMPNQSITLDDLDPGVALCIRSREKCLAYEAHPHSHKTKRVGNVAADLLTFKRKTIESGWSFRALVVINDGVVVYKVWSGEPLRSSGKTRKNPLGPLQSIDGSTAAKAL